MSFSIRTSSYFSSATANIRRMISALPLMLKYVSLYWTMISFYLPVVDNNGKREASVCDRPTQKTHTDVTIALQQIYSLSPGFKIRITCNIIAHYIQFRSCKVKTFYYLHYCNTVPSFAYVALNVDYVVKIIFPLWR